MQQPKWKVSTFVAIAALAAFYVVISLPGGMVAGATGMAMMAAVVNIVIIGIMYALVPLVMRRFGAATLWAFLFSVIMLPLPIGGPAGLIIKIPYLTFWGFLADVTYQLFKKSDKVAAIMISVIQLGPGVYVSVWLWMLLGSPALAAETAKMGGPAVAVILSVIGAALGWVAYFIYGKLKNTAVVKRIQAE
ncbi:MAG: hypothetical protein WCX69_02810 [Candidatus Paceibacterota bacterium]